MSRWKFIIVIIGASFFFRGWDEWRLSALTQATPVSMTLDELAQNGPGDNAHLVISDFFLCTWDYVYVGTRGSWNEAWVPAVPLGGEFHRQFTSQLDEDGSWPEELDIPKPEEINVVFKLTQARDKAYVKVIASLDRVRGLVINEIESLESDERDLLARSYPNVDYSSVYIFEPERSPRSDGVIYVMLIGGAFVALAGVFMTVGGFSRSRATASQGAAEEAPSA